MPTTVTYIDPKAELVMVGRKEAPSGWVAPYRAASIYYEELEIDLESIILINNE